MHNRNATIPHRAHSPAFPCEASATLGRETGMTLRQYYAGEAMKALLINGGTATGKLGFVAVAAADEVLCELEK